MLSKPYLVVATVSLVASVAPRMVYAQTAQPSVASPNEDRRRALYQEGKAAIKAMHWVDAKTALEQAWAISPSYDVALLLAQAELNLSHYPESARLLAYYFRNVSAKENEKTYNNAKQGFERAKQKVSAVTVTAPSGAEVWVDGKSVGSAPLEGAVFVNPGKRTFEARRGDLRSQQELEAVAGQEQAVSLSLQEAPAPAAASATHPEASVGAGLSEPVQPAKSTPPVDRHDAGERSLVPVIIGGAATALALGVGVAYSISGASKQSDVVRLNKNSHAQLGGNCDPGSTAQVCRDLAKASDDRNSANSVARIAFISSGVLLAGTAAAYFLWPTRPATTTRIVPLAGSNFAGLTVQGGF